MRIAGISTAVVVVLVLSRISEAAPAEGLTPFRFFMARAYGQPEEHTVMRFIRFKPSDGAKFRETFEQKHGPRGRDLIESLGQGSYNKLSATVTEDPPRDTNVQIAAAETSSSKTLSTEKPVIVESQRSTTS